MINKNNKRRTRTKRMGLAESESNFINSIKNGTLTTEKVKDFMYMMLQSGEYNNILENYFTGMYRHEHKEKVQTILENEDLLTKQELTLYKLEEQIQEAKDALLSNATVEAYLNRNSTKKQLNLINENNELNIKQTMTTEEELATKTYIKNIRNYDFVIERMAKGSTFRQALIEANVDKYSIDLILRGVNALNEGNELVSVRSNHLY
ncbi:hypothetical protein SAMN06314019_10417 [Epsilonproteobacteria bacterium SCGC AD-311-C15]|jgi:hypothetical protein|nr:hypothetical protein SAMN06314019_10417 [Epsilonproteobacteria bacterium SCGC AD-311-C15]